MKGKKMKEKLKNLKKKIDDNQDLILAGIYFAGASILAGVIVYALKNGNNAINAMADEQREILADSIEKGYTILSTEDNSLWYVFEPESVKHLIP